MIAPATCTKNELQTIRLFAGLTAEQFDWLGTRIRIEELAAETRIVGADKEATCVFFLLRGTVKICTQRRFDHEVVFDILGPGEVIGDLSAIDGLGHSANVITLENSCVASLPCPDFLEALTEMPTLSRNLISILARRLRRRTGQAETLASLDVCGRLGHHLVLYAEDYGVPVEGKPEKGTLLPLRLTQSDLGGLIGASRERVNRALNYFKRQGYVSLRHDGYMVLHNADALRQRHPRL